MSWTADLYICEPSPWSDDLYVGELRPWPDAVRVWRDNTDEPWPDAVRVRRGNTDEMMLYTITPLPHFWTGDGTLHIEPRKLPERIDVALPDKRGREVHSARVHRFVLERTCHDVHEPLKDTTFWPVPHFKCSECGATHVSMEYVYFCPKCGARVEVDE